MQVNQSTLLFVAALIATTIFYAALSHTQGAQLSRVRKILFSLLFGFAQAYGAMFVLALAMFCLFWTALGGGHVPNNTFSMLLVPFGIIFTSTLIFVGACLRILEKRKPANWRLISRTSSAVIMVEFVLVYAGMAANCLFN